MIEIRHHDKLVQSSKAYALAMQAAAPLMTAGLIRHFPGSWDKPIIEAVVGQDTVGVLNYYEEPDNSETWIEFVAVDEKYRGGAQVLILLLSAFNRKVAVTSSRTIRYAYHPSNPLMKDAARILGGEIHSISVSIPVQPGAAEEA